MNRARYQLFTRATLSVDQHGARGGSNRSDRRFQLVHGAAGANDVVERVTSSGIAAQGEVLLAENLLLQHAVHGQLDFIHQARVLADVVGGTARLHGLHRGFVVVNGSDENDGGIRRNAMRVA